MTDVNLQRANELKPLIAKVKENIARWEDAYDYRSEGYVDVSSSGSSYNSASMIHVPFDVVKTLSLHGFRKHLEKLENEFNSL